MSQPPLKLIRKALRYADDSIGDEGHIEVDHDVSEKELRKSVSACDEWQEEGGFYVRAWVWVSIEELERFAQ